MPNRNERELLNAIVDQLDANLLDRGAGSPELLDWAKALSEVYDLYEPDAVTEKTRVRELAARLRGRLATSTSLVESLHDLALCARALSNIPEADDPRKDIALAETRSVRHIRTVPADS